ncbi:nitronate monooxygenase [Variovorax sp. CF079]|uniref:NAD(P)H-dependent flavin oxidoreductase n=1 Tax=Variovorax sp. CF079 TaxID=1882774 RepID=UPI00244E6795|nr:nitronate monooxygenase [Variovorax sp. CF079]
MPCCWNHCDPSGRVGRRSQKRCGGRRRRDRGSRDRGRRTRPRAVGLLALLPTVVEAVAPRPVLAAGGIANGRGLAAALSLGAEGVWIGTRFVASDECAAHPEYKRRLLEARETDAVYSDIPRVPWPTRVPHRLLKSPLTEGRSPPSRPIARNLLGDKSVDVLPFASAPPTIETVGRTELMPNYAGQGVGLIHEILPAAAIVEQVVSEAHHTIRRLPELLT